MREQKTSIGRKNTVISSYNGEKIVIFVQEYTIANAYSYAQNAVTNPNLNTHKYTPTHTHADTKYKSKIMYTQIKSLLSLQI